MTRRIVGAGIAVIIIIAVLGCAQAARKQLATPAVPQGWIKLNDNAAVEVRPCGDAARGTEIKRGDLCGTLMVSTAADKAWHRVLLDAAPPAVGIHPIMQ